MFRVGSGRYSLRITEEPLFIDGVECYGRCREADRTIYLSAGCPVNRRLNTLFHELAHAWIYAVGLPKTEEDACDFNATVTEMALEDLDRMGGKAALFRLFPGERPSAASSRIALTRNRYCPQCQGTIPGCQVICEPVATRVGHMRVTIYCEHCDCLARWEELSSLAGYPTGTVVGEPVIERGEAVRRFIHEHPDAANYCQTS